MVSGVQIIQILSVITNINKHKTMIKLSQIKPFIIQAVMRSLNTLKNRIKITLLSNVNMWYLHDEWYWSLEMDGYRKPRQFYKHKMYKDYLITSVFTKKPTTKENLIVDFVEKYKNERLIMGRTSLHNEVE